MKNRKSNIPAQRRRPLPPPPPDRWMKFLYLAERCSWSQVTQNSYVISRFWAWFSRIELSPQVKVPVPRILTYRDP